MTSVRAATVDDAEAMAMVHVRAWQSGYADIMPAEFLAGLSVDDRAAMWRRSIADGRAQILVAEDAVGAVTGFACSGLERDDGLIGELYALNVDPAAWGRGHGRALLQAATAWLATQWPEAVLWVAEVNPRARGLYESEGWRADGTRRVDDAGGAVVAEVRYHRSLAGA